MNKSILIFFIIILMLSMGIASAETLKTEKFTGFSIGVPEDSNLVKQATGEDSTNFGIDDAYFDDSNQLMVEYVETDMFNDENINFFYQRTFEYLNSDIDECWESQEGNMTIMIPIKNSDTTLPMVGVNEGNQTLLIIGEDADLIKSMGRTVEFN